MFSEKISLGSDERGDRLQSLSLMDKHYKGKLISGILTYYCWKLETDLIEAKYSNFCIDHANTYFHITTKFLISDHELGE